MQLAHACLAAGFDVVIPASWGDELVAARVLARAESAGTPVVQCSCPRVAQRLAAHGQAIAPHIVATLPPPAATALYLREILAPAQPRVTFAGGCPGGAHASINVWWTPHDLSSHLSARGVSLENQPTEFDVLPPDRRRFYSEPGGLPSRASLLHLARPVSRVELHDSDFATELGQHLLGDEPVLIDVATALRCECAGAGYGTVPVTARARVREHEPPRAPGPIVEHGVTFLLDADMPVAREAGPIPAGVPAMGTSAAAASLMPAQLLVSPEVARRRSPPGMPRPVLGAAPRRQTEGRTLPRAYVARRRSSPQGMRTSQAGVSIATATSSPGITGRRVLWIGGGLLAGAGLMWLARLLT